MEKTEAENLVSDFLQKKVLAKINEQKADVRWDDDSVQLVWRPLPWSPTLTFLVLAPSRVTVERLRNIV